jgi:N-acetylmuramic acid 6-phosphate etherase
MAEAGVVGVDVGKTGARCSVWPGPPVPPAADAPPSGSTTASGHPGLAAPGGIGAVAQLVRALVDPAIASTDAAGWSLGVGVAGALAAPERAQDLADRLADALPGARVAVASDAVTAHCGARTGGPGIVATLGTGVSVLALAADGRSLLVDGAGHYIGDRGGGAQLGRQALRAVLRERDGAGPATALTPAAVVRFGALSDLPARFAEADNPARLAASFAPDVARCALSGDEISSRILQAAVGEIAASIRAAHDRAGGALPVVLTGGLLELGAALLDPLRSHLAGLDLREPAADAIHGAARLAVASDTAWEPAVRRARTRGAPLPDAPLERLATERARPGSDRLERLPVAGLVEALLQHEDEALGALRAAGPALARAIEAVIDRMREGGRLIYVGAGTPGRLAFLDSAECEPTFGIAPGLIEALLAGGDQALRRAAEGAEDDAEEGARGIAGLAVTPADTVVGITASGRTPYVLGALRAARAVGALTIGIANNPGSELSAIVEHPVEIDSGAEVVAGSTRLAAGTTQKVALNTLSTAIMIGLGKTYRARMVDVQATNGKLRDRVVRIVRDLAEVDEQAAAAAVAAAGGEAKTAVVALLAGLSPEQARAALAAAGGRVAGAVGEPRE